MATDEITLYKRLDEQLATLVDNFSLLARSAMMPEDEDEAGESGMPGELPEVFAARLLQSSHTCLDLVSELKKTAIHSDVGALTNNMRFTKKDLQVEADSSDAQLRSVRREAEELLGRLEQHFYKSRHKGEPPPPRDRGPWEDLFVRGMAGARSEGTG
eukprot:evm.model.scf_1238.4 EVM.evm.TU.scf_1238.4   scf_1238:36976-39430(+)